jgi:hypothetical protein
MKNKIYKPNKLILSLVLILYIFLTGFSGPALAQDFSLSIYPPLLKAMIKPGKTISQVYKLTNQGPDTQVYTFISQFKPADSQGHVQLLLEEAENIADQPKYFNWFSWQNSDINLPGGFLLKSGQTQELVLRIKVPEAAEEKDYYVSLVFKSQAAENTINFNTAQTTGILASNIILTVSESGQPAKTGQIVKFEPESKFKLPFFNLAVFDSFDQINLSLVAKNDGQTVFTAHGLVKIVNPLNKQIKFINIVPQNILANSKRQLMAEAEDEDLIIKTISFKPAGFALGKYQAQAELVIADSKNIMTGQTEFLIVPWKAGLGFAIALILLSFIKKIVN